VDVLVRKSREAQTQAGTQEFGQYDLYGTFGCCLGEEPTLKDDEVNGLTACILPLAGGEFYHFGTSHELLSSTLAIENLVYDQRRIMHTGVKPHPSMFVQNAITRLVLKPENTNLWIENSVVGTGWTLSHENIITGVPENDWNLSLAAGQCLDIVPIREDKWAVRPYGFFDKFAGDEQWRKRYPVVSDVDEMGMVARRMLEQGVDDWQGGGQYELLSAAELSELANLRRLVQQRRHNRKTNWQQLRRNYQQSVFYQVDLRDAAREYVLGGIPSPEPLPMAAPLMTRMGDAMFRATVLDGQENGAREASKARRDAFQMLGDGLTADAEHSPQKPRMNVYADQIVWARSPVRMDISGGWTDTPPYCLMEGGAVVNIAIELNGQPPIQAFVKPCAEHHIVLRSIDLGQVECVTSYDELADYRHVGSAFAIPKAALVLAGFHPRFSASKFDSLERQLEVFGCGLELTTLSAVPAGSGLGTSSILAATVLGALSDFCSLAWDKNEIGRRTLMLEQLLTTGGGWQDQFGGLLHGAKLLQTTAGWSQNPVVRFLPDNIFTQPEYKACHLLYYTGITRTAKTILAEIVERMFLNDHDELALLREMKEHSLDMADAIQREDFVRVGHCLRRNWQQNKTLDVDSNPLAVERLTSLVDDLCLGYKLPGAGGGGYLYMIAKSPDAAVRIKQIVNDNRINDKARFVDMSLSTQGLQVTRS